MNDNITAPLNRLIRLPEVMRRTGMSRSWIYEAVRAGRFPGPLRLGGRAVAWRESDIAAWVEKLGPTTPTTASAS